jgi:hypothetical protein
MDGIIEWISIGISFAILAATIISVWLIWLSVRKEKKKIDVLGKLIFVYQSEVELLKRSYPEQLAFQQQWLALQKQKQENEDNWRKLTAVGKFLKFIAENSDQ